MLARPATDRSRSIAHGLRLPVRRGDRTRIEVIATDHDRRFDLARAHELVEPAAGAGALAVAEPTDARGQPLKLDTFARGFDPAHERGIVRELVDDRAVGSRDVSRVARKRNPSKWALALAEQGPDVRRHKTRIVASPRAAAKARLRTQAVAVVEYLCAPVEKRDHSVHMARHALSCASDVRVGLVEP